MWWAGSVHVAHRTKKIRLGVGALGVLMASATLTACSSGKPTPYVTAVPTGLAASPYFLSPDDPAAAASQIAAHMADDDLIGTVLMPAVNMDDPATGAAALVREHRLGGVILMGQPPSGAG